MPEPTPLTDARQAAERLLRDLSPARRLRTRLATQRLLAWAEDRPIRLLDAGCDVGLLSLALARRRPDWTLEGVDVNDEILDIARAWAAEAGLEIAYRHADITRDLPSDAYDVAVALECLTQLPDPDAAVAGLSRALRPGGLLAAHVPEADWAPALPGSPHEWPGETRHGFTPDGIAELLDRHGLRLTWIEATSRTPVQAAQELRDRIRDAPVRTRLAAFPVFAATEWLERHGIAFGPPRGLYVEAVRR
jgi:SAM-dependent methyltransferase